MVSKSKFQLLQIFFVIQLLQACMFNRPENLHMISAEQLQTTMAKQDIFLVDVHIPEQKHIKGTDQFIPFHKINNYKDKLPSDKRAPIYLYCESGPMGNYAAKALFKLGYSNIYNLEGGIKAWHRFQSDSEK